MNSKTIISVIIPVYNGENFLNDCIDSITRQTIFDNLEIIFVNDASTDNTLEILKEKSELYPNLIVLNNETNMRQGAARNRGLNEATGEYIGFVDADDIIAPDMFEILFNALVKYEADVVYCEKDTISENIHYSDLIFPESILDNKILNITDENRAEFLLSERGCVWSGLYKKSLIIDNNVFFPEKLRFEDNYWVTLMKCYFNKVVVLDKYKGYYYRLNSASTTHLKNAFDLFDERIVVEKMILEQLHKRNLFEQYIEVWEYFYIQRYAFSTFISYLRLFSSIPYSRIAELQDGLSKEFPNWRNNKYLSCVSANSNRVKRVLFDMDVRRCVTHIVYKAIWLYYFIRR